MAAVTYNRRRFGSHASVQHSDKLILFLPPHIPFLTIFLHHTEKVNVLDVTIDSQRKFTDNAYVSVFGLLVMLEMISKGMSL